MQKKVERKENVKRKNERQVKQEGKYMPKEVTEQGKQAAKLTKSHS